METNVSKVYRQIDSFSGYSLTTNGERYCVVNPAGREVADSASKADAISAMKLLTGYVGLRSSEL